MGMKVLQNREKEKKNLRNDESDNEEYEKTTTTDELKNLKAI